MDVSIDYETYSECDITAAGSWSYAMHPSTEILIASWAIDNGKVHRWTCNDPPSKLQPLIDLMCNPDVRLWAWNANFERGITKYVGERMLGMPALKSRRWYCSAALSLGCALPGSLGRAWQALGLDVAKDTTGKALIKIFSMPQRDKDGAITGRTRPEENPIRFEEFVSYCEQDVRTERAVRAALPVSDYNKWEHINWMVDSVINERGVYLDRQLIHGARQIAERWSTRLLADLDRITEGRVTSPGQHAKFKAELATHGVKIPESLDKVAVGALLKKDLSPEARKLLHIRQSLGKTSVAKFEAAHNAICPDERVRGMVLFRGAHTGRFAGRIIQLHNLYRPTCKTDADLPAIRAGDMDHLELFYGDPLEALRNSIRPMLRAPPGKHLLSCDWNAIEARVLGWIAKEAFYQDAFSAGRDLYKEMAVKIFNVPIEKVTDDQRFLGKTSILGLGYSMSEDKFILTCRDKGVPVARADDKTLRRAACIYREVCVNIVAFWRKVEQCFVSAIMTKRPVYYNGLEFGREGKHAYILLPSGRPIWYPFATAKFKMTPWGKEKLQAHYFHDNGKGGELHNWWVETSTHGGKITENVVQAISADLLTEALKNCELDPRLDVTTHTHDEILAEADPSVPASVLADIMLIRPAWALDLPLVAEAKALQHYTK